jgi:hypothetical protein
LGRRSAAHHAIAAAWLNVIDGELADLRGRSMEKYIEAERWDA